MNDTLPILLYYNNNVTGNKHKHFEDIKLVFDQQQHKAISSLLQF